MGAMTTERARRIALRETRKDYLLSLMAWDAFGGTKRAALAGWKATVSARVAELMAEHEARA